MWIFDLAWQRPNSLLSYCQYWIQVSNFHYKSSSEMCLLDLKSPERSCVFTKLLMHNRKVRLFLHTLVWKSHLFGFCNIYCFHFLLLSIRLLLFIPSSFQHQSLFLSIFHPYWSGTLLSYNFFFFSKPVMAILFIFKMFWDHISESRRWIGINCHILWTLHLVLILFYS